MKRRYSSAGFLERCRRLRQALDQPALTTDVIVGFPGETDADFEATCRVVREVGFVKIHVFPYSRRQGTPAAELPDAVPPPVVAARCDRLAELEQSLAASFMRSLMGRRLDVLVEGPDASRPGHVRGTSCRHVSVSFEGLAPALVRRVVPVRITGLADGMLLGRPESETEAGRFALPLTEPRSRARVCLDPPRTMVH
jgi:threonylcarbamoyladenosine tRNA methylthiotransferase MtaB